MENKILVDAKKINKSFGGIRALYNVDFDLNEGEIHGLVGHNGAGKSTLINILSGIINFDSGSLILKNKKVEKINPIISKKSGIYVVFQKPVIQPNMTVAENLFVNNWPKYKSIKIDWQKIKKDSKSILKKLEIDIDINKIVGNLNIAQQKMIEIANAINKNSKILLLDEPTAALTINEIRLMFSFLKTLKQNGVGIVYISHHGSEIFEICDRVTVLRNGEKVITENVSNLNMEKLTNYILGGPVLSIKKEKNNLSNNKILDLKELNTDILKSISLFVKEGEILGISGLNGSGRTELLKAICGLDSAKIKDFIFLGRKLKIKNYTNALSKGIAYLPENRYKEGIIPLRSIKENMTLSSLNLISNILKILRKKMELLLVKKYVDILSIKLNNINDEIISLSGGNQQKVVLSKLLLSNAKLFLLDEPTSGIDIGTKVQIFNYINNFVAKGNSVILVSSELNELLLVCDRILILREGRIIKEIEDVNNLNEDKLLKIITN